MKPSASTRHCERRVKRTLISILILVLITNGVAFADPTLPLPRLPICGDQDGSESPLALHCTQYAHFPDVQTYTLPGPGIVTFKADFVYREADYNNELGFFVVDDLSGAIGGRKPGDAGYLDAAFNAATIIFPSGSYANAPDFSIDLPSATVMVFFIVQNSTLGWLRANNPMNRPDRSPLAFFSLDALNPDGVDHFVGYTHIEGGLPQFGFEDLTGGGDRDYDDVVYNVQTPMQPAAPPGPLSLPFPHAEDDNGLNHVWSFFDHEYPIYDREPTTVATTTVTYTGERLAGTVMECVAGSSCYSGHNGIDFTYGLDSTTPVLAAADGTIVPAPAGSCAGNEVRINHGQYLTIYSHLQDDQYWQKSGEVKAGERIGTVGNSVGACGKSTGYHLHFGVYFDQNEDGVFSPDEIVDPFGWRDQCSDIGTDPWTVTFEDINGTKHTGATSQWLWNFDPPTCARITRGAAYSFVASDGTVVRVPGGATSNSIILTYNIAPERSGYTTAAPVAAIAVHAEATTTIAIGHTFQLSAVTAAGAPVMSFSAPLSITVPYSAADVVFGDDSSLALYRWDEASESWMPLPSSQDATGQQVAAPSQLPGIFSLRALPRNAAPAIAEVSPVGSPSARAGVITVTGAHFMATPSLILGLSGLEAHFVSSTVLTATVPSGLAPGLYDLIVRNPDGQQVIAPAVYRVYEAVWLPLLTR